MTESTEPPQLEFPCQYPIKVMGNASEDFVEHVIQLLEPFCGQISQESIAIKTSGKGNYHSITVTITATGKEQLSQIAAALNSDPRVLMSL